MKKSIKLRAVFAFIALLFIISSFMPLNVLAKEMEENNSGVGEQKIYANVNINDNFVDNAVLIMFNNEISLRCNTITVNDFNEIDVANVRNLSSKSEERVIKAKDNIVRSVTQDEPFVLDSGLNMSEFNQVFRLEISESGKDKVVEAIEKLQRRDDLLYVGPDYIGTFCSGTYEEIEFLDDFCDGWYYSHIQLDEAWDELKRLNVSDDPIRVAVFDSGIASAHPALQNSMNTNESANYDPGTSNEDFFGHGTNVAGIIKGVADNVELISMKISNDDVVECSHAIAAMDDIANFENPVPIVNFSIMWKITEGSQSTDVYDPILEDYIRDYDGLVVCAAGNNGVNIVTDTQYDYYLPQCNLSNIIVVGASTQSDGIQEVSNYGYGYVDVFAPGELIYTTNMNHDYETVGLTSMATPFVTGIAAMLLMINDDLQPADLIHIIKSTVDTAYSEQDVDGIAVNKGTDIQDLNLSCSSSGRINAYKAVLEAIDYDTTPACTHSNYYYTYDATTHTLRCSDCSYTSSASHDLYVFTDYGESGVTIKCYQCNFERFCNIGVAEYGYGGENGHYVSCTCGCYSFFTAHRVTYIMQTSSLTTHNVYCGDCGTTYLAAHSWIPSGFGYECALCAMTTLTIPDIMQIPSGDEILIASGDENGTAIALLPEKEDDLVTE